MPPWLQTVIGMIGGFFAGRLGSAVDHEMRAQHGVRTTVPALLEAQRSTNRALDVITDKLTTMAKSELELREELAQFRQESSRSREAVGRALRAQAARINQLDQRFDAMSDAQGVLYTRNRPLDPYLPSTRTSPGSHPACPAGHWVPPMDRPGWGQQTEPETEEP